MHHHHDPQGNKHPISAPDFLPAEPMSDEPADMFAPPVNRAMKVLDRAFFQRTVPTSAARIFNPRDIARVRSALDRGHDTLKTRLDSVRVDPEPARAAKGEKCLILKPEVLHNGTTHSYPASTTTTTHAMSGWV